MRPGFTVVEVLVVVAIVAALIGLLLPAIHIARESARRSSCCNNLRQLGLAAKTHVDSQGIFPTGGWGAMWVGDPDLGYGPRQPGGWIYNILPYIEHANLRQIGSRLAEKEKRLELRRLLQSPIEFLQCPSRRPCVLYPYSGPDALRNVDPPAKVAKSDYAINSSVSHEKSEVTIAEIRVKNGMSHTVLVGEKAMSADHYADGFSSGDQLNMFVGDSSDIARGVLPPPSPDSAQLSGAGFGSSHPSGCHEVFCDGSVKFLTYDPNTMP
jgi:prepilin-type N-terminal cleavage/methylation domain-containing protein